MTKNYFLLTLLYIVAVSCCNSGADGDNINHSWRFMKAEKGDTALYSAASLDDSKWEKINLPHTANIEVIGIDEKAWQGICWYRKDLRIDNFTTNKNYFIEFEAAMNICDVWVNGEKAKSAQGGFLPIVIDVTKFVKSGNNTIAVRLNNHDNPITGPKPLSKLDFVMYSGLYRKAHFIEKNSLYITHPNLANKVAGGGVFVTFDKIDTKESQVNVKCDVANSSDQPQNYTIINIVSKDGVVVKKNQIENLTAQPKSSKESQMAIKISSPKLWNINSPELYNLETLVVCGSDTLDRASTRFGIRKIEFIGNQLYINGKKEVLRGVNRHQEYPYIGYAASDNAQYRDAYIIKNSGFDYIRLSHYPQSPAFMDSCDELGLLVLDDMMGWQYYSDDPRFIEHSYDQARQMIRRDRNHPSVLAWEVSLNETRMPVPFMDSLHAIAHEEHPGEGVFSCGWMDDSYDIYLQARQHRILHPTETNFKKPYAVSEYGDWEYWSNNGGLNQHKLAKTKRRELSSRQYRRNGEKALLIQAHNIQEAHNANRSIPAFGDTYWVMFDYNSGCGIDMCNSGVMDINRIPKFGYYFYRSQRDVVKEDDCVLHIASYWDENSDKDVRVFSNCDMVELFVNGKLVAKQRPDKNNISNNLKHPPFTFKNVKFEKGELKAVAYLKGKKVKEQIVRTPQAPVALKCWIAENGKEAEAGCNDNLFVYIAAVDKNGTICPTYDKELSVVIEGGARIMNNTSITCEAGIAAVMIEVGKDLGEWSIDATSKDGIKGSTKLAITKIASL